ncbi:transcription factor gata4/5/6 [Plakobranchus ocellatus]|uniref:Transcription factor gata4/5/6 n=1 Tax=Plakobranchus ocellatus TaxID=259542 RepID=A0AAV4A1P8_9GAST|nr:transcription factor gata4/5/6 [Plakobranchus ocellatus]
MQPGGQTSSTDRLIPKSLLPSKDVEIFFDHLDRTCPSPAFDGGCVHSNGWDTRQQEIGSEGVVGEQDLCETKTDKREINHCDRNGRNITPAKERKFVEGHSIFTEACFKNSVYFGDCVDSNAFCRNDSSSSSSSTNSNSSRSSGTSNITSASDKSPNSKEGDKTHQGKYPGVSTLSFCALDLRAPEDRPSGDPEHSPNPGRVAAEPRGQTLQQQQEDQPVSMYQGGIALTPSAGGYGQDTMTNGYLHSGTSPVYVPSNRAMLPVQYMATPNQSNMATPSTNSALWSTTPTAGDVSAYATQASQIHASAGAFPYNGTAGGAGASPGSGRSDGGYGTPLGRHAASGLGGYPVTAAAAAAAYMGADLSPWNTFNNMALQQGFRPTTGPGKSEIVAGLKDFERATFSAVFEFMKHAAKVSVCYVCLCEKQA